MASVVVGYYLGLFVFAINGLVMMAMRQERVKRKADEERWRKLLMRYKMRIGGRK